MAKQKSYSTTEAKFIAEINIDIPYLNLPANKSRLVLTTAATEALGKAVALLSTYNANLHLCNSSSTSTSTIVANKNSNAVSLLDYAHTIIGDIPQSVLTQADYDTLNLSAGSAKRTPTKKPASTPVLSVTEHNHLSLTINVADSSQPSKKAKPDDADGIEVETAIFPLTDKIPEGGPTDSQFNHVANSGKTKVTLSFETDEVKSTIYLRARYYNSNKEPGNWSETINTIII